jgi:hypothetical protein
MGVAQVSHAQSANVYFGLGTATDGSSNQQIDTFGTGMPFTTPKLGGSFLGLGASILFTKTLGAGADVSWRATHATYAGLQVMPIFYDFDGIYAPVATKHFEPELHAGLGGMSLRYSFTQQQCDPLVGCSNYSQSIESSNHFQLHFGGAVRYYMTDHVFLRPSVDLHYVTNLFQFGSDIVPEYSLGVGYSFGREQ